jgi:hypothetical protein
MRKLCALKAIPQPVGGLSGARPPQSGDRSHRAWGGVLAAGAALLMLLAGCGKPTAQAVAAQYVNLMKTAKFKDAALLWDYSTEARKQNDSWDDIPESQRKLIIGKLAEEKATTLQLWDGYFPRETKVQSVTESGDTAQAVLQGGKVGSLSLMKSGDNWRIIGMN